MSRIVKPLILIAIASLATAAHALDDAELAGHERRLTARILDDASRGGWLCGTPRHLEIPGLLNGIAGIGHALLRLARPEAVASVLTLQSPTGVGRLSTYTA